MPTNELLCACGSPRARGAALCTACAAERDTHPADCACSKCELPDCTATFHQPYCRYSTERRAASTGDPATVICPACHAQPGMLCRNADGCAVDMHQARIALAEQQSALTIDGSAAVAFIAGPGIGDEKHEARFECTGWAASWCPIHGDCNCPRRPNGERMEGEAPRCPLHSRGSTHAEAPPAPDPRDAKIAALEAELAAAKAETAAAAEAERTWCADEFQRWWADDPALLPLGSFEFEEHLRKGKS